MGEIWKNIPGYEGLYQASNFGKIRGLRKTKYRIFRNKINSKGYFNIRLRDKNNKRYGYLVHRLIALTFIPNPNNKAQVNHIDGNKTNNEISNLEWVTPKENMIHCYKIIYSENGIKIKSQNKRFKERLILHLEGLDISKKEDIINEIRNFK